jgi:hypothetical protein
VVLGIAIAVLGAGIGVAVWQLTRTDHRTTARTVDEALADFRSGTDVEVDTAGLPAPGVYVYRTTGADGVDALGGAEHAYPAITTITVRPSGCGVTARWDVAVERWDETTSCETDNGVVRTAFVSFHEFFGMGNTDTEACAGDPRPIGADPDTTWTFECAEDDSVTPWVGRALGNPTIDVSGTAVPTNHVLLLTPDDPDGDDMRIETWYAAGTDLIVREIGSRRTTDPSPIGDVHYEEQYEIVLTSLEPLR